MACVVSIGAALGVAGAGVAAWAGAGAGAASGAGAGVVVSGAIMDCVVSAMAPVSGALRQPRIHQASNNTMAMPITQGSHLRWVAFVSEGGDAVMSTLRYELSGGRRLAEADAITYRGGRDSVRMASLRDKEKTAEPCGIRGPCNLVPRNKFNSMELTGIEPVTSAMRMQRSPS